jgi:membrane-bound lytic murein transglycosylase A
LSRLDSLNREYFIKIREQLMRKLFFVFLLVLLTASCSNKNVKPVASPALPECTPTQPTAPIQIPEPNLPLDMPAVAPEQPANNGYDYPLLKPASWEALDGFLKDDLSASWHAWLTSCTALANKSEWQNACQAATQLKNPTSAQIAEYYTTYFDVYSTSTQSGSNIGLITGYYEPMLKGSRKRSSKYPYPLYGQPKDLITVELGDVYPELKYKRIRGKLEGNKLKPYLTRADIESNPSPLAGSEIVWVDDALDAFFLQIQGSGVIQLDNGKQMHIGYANQNGYPYQSIGRLLVERGELDLSQASMQGIKNWARTHLDKLRELLNSNPSYVFFRELPKDLFGPLGALGVPLTAERSVAIDPKYIPLGAPVFLSTTYPNSDKTLKRLMMAQDTGGAIKDGVRADFYWGSGDMAGKMAGAMKQEGKIWVLLPKEFKLNR